MPNMLLMTRVYDSHTNALTVIPRLYDTAGCQSGCQTGFDNRVERTASVHSTMLNEQPLFDQPAECLYTRYNRLYRVYKHLTGHLELAMFNPRIPNLKSLHNCYEDIKGNAKCRNCGLGSSGTTQGHRQCRHSIEHIQDFLIDFIRSCVRLSSTVPAFGASVGGDPV